MVLAGSGICLTLVVLTAAYNNAYYARDPGWQAFFDYNKLRIKFNDYCWTRYTPETAGIFAAVGWTANDHALIQDWFYDDSALYSAANLRSVLDSLSVDDQTPHAALCRNLYRADVCDKSLWPMVLALPLALWGVTRSRQYRLAWWGTIAAGLTLLVAVAVFNKPPPSRVYFPTLTFPLVLLLFMSSDQVTWPRRRWPALAVRCFVLPTLWRRPAARALLRRRWCTRV